MAFDKRKALQAALAHTQQGRWDKAINEYQAILKADPNDLSVYNLLGDLYARIGKKEEAISYYHKLGELLQADGLSVKAIAVYKKVIKLDPTNIPSFLACGDLYAEQGLIAEARIQYLTAADFYGKQGATKKALGVYQKLADLDPSNLAIRAKLAEMLLKEGLQKEAADELLKVASGCIQIGQLTEAEKFYRRTLQIQPDSTDARLGLGQVYYRSNDFSNAILQLSQVVERGQANAEMMLILADSYGRSRQLERAEEVLSRIIEGNAQHQDARVSLGRIKLQMGKIEEGYRILDELAEGYLRGNEAGKGLELLKEVAEVDPNFLKVRRRLADIYFKMGDEAGARNENKGIAEILFRQNNWEEARNAYRSILEAEPENEQVKLRFAQLEERLKEQESERGRRGDISAPSGVEPLATGTPLESAIDFSKIRLEEEVEAIDVGTIEERFGELVPSPVEELEEEVPEDPSTEEVKEHLVEADVYLKYSLIDKAIDHLKRILEISPDNPKAHQRLKGIHLDRGDHQAAIGECLALAEIYERKGQIPRAISEIESILKIDPGHEIGKRKRRELTSRSLSAMAEEIVSSSLEQIPIWEEVSEEAISLEPPLEMVAPSADLGAGEAETAGLGLAPAIQEEELPEGLKDFLEDLEEGKKAAPETISLVQEPEAAAAAGVEEDLAEADFYLQHEMLEEAKSVYRRILRDDPSNKIARERLSKLEPSAVPEEAAAPTSQASPTIQPRQDLASSDRQLKVPPAGPRYPEIPLSKEVTPVFKVAAPISARPDEPFVDFAAELEKELERDEEEQRKALQDLAKSQMAPPTLNEILQEFRKGVRQTLEEKDFQTHYDLGIAYKDMDLLEEAIEEFRLAAKEPSLTLDCSQLIGLCYMKMGATKSAIEEFLKGLSIPDQRPEQYRGLKYELALAYEASGNLQNAIDLYSDILREDPGFRDAANKVKSIRPLQPRPSERKGEGPPIPEKEEPEPPVPKTGEEAKKPPAPKSRRRKVDYI